MPRVELSNGLLFAHRIALTEVDVPNSPVAWADDEWIDGGNTYNDLKITVKGFAWGTVSLTFRLWRRGTDGPEKCGSFTVASTTAEDAILTDAGSVTYQVSSVVDDGQDFDLVKPVGAGDPSLYGILAEPATTADPAFMAWAATGGIPGALNVRTTHFGDEEGDEGGHAGWAGGSTPDGSVVQYEVLLPNIDWADVFDGLTGDDVAITLESKSGTGQFLVDVGAVPS